MAIPDWDVIAGCGALLGALVGFRLAYCAFMDLVPPAVRAPNFGSRFVSSIHCVGIVSLASLYIAGEIADETLLWGRYLSAGYLIHDYTLMIEEPSIRVTEDLVHHIAFLAVLPFAHPFPDMYARGMLSEASLPFLYTSWAIIKLQKLPKYRTAFWVNSIIGVIMFFVFRVVNFTLLMVHVWHHYNALVIVASAAITALNYFWFGKLLAKALSPASPSVA